MPLPSARAARLGARIPRNVARLVPVETLVEGSTLPVETADDD
jgi:hypothetical protein